MIRMTCTLCAVLVCAAFQCVAAEHGQFEDHHAHEHGVATLDVAIDGPELLLQFRSPAMNLVGFEHPPRSDQDRAAVTKATSLLRDPVTQFIPSAEARCQAKATKVTTPDFEQASEHSEFAAEYRFSCERPDLLRQLHVRLLDALDEHVRIEVQVTSRQGQRAAELTRSSPRLAVGAGK